MDIKLRNVDTLPLPEKKWKIVNGNKPCPNSKNGYQTEERQHTSAATSKKMEYRQRGLHELKMAATALGV
jgi:hypothetical protein